jgi:glutaredoxin
MKQHNLTKQQIQFYNQTGFCPYCKSDKVYDWDIKECYVCKKKWKNVTKIVDIIEIKR